MLVDFVKNGTWYSVSNFITKGLAFFLVPLYTRILSPHDYGIIDIVSTIAALVNVTISLEISQGLARFFVEADNLTVKRQYVSTAFWFTALVYAVFFIVAMLTQTSLMQFIFDGETNQVIFFMMACSVAVNGIYIFLQNQLRWSLLVREGILCNIINAVGVMIVTVYSVCVLHYGVMGVFLGLTVGATVSSVVGFLYIKKFLQWYISLQCLKNMLKFSVPLVFSSLLVVLTMYIDRWVIKEYLSLSAVGVYGIGYRVASIATLITSGFQNALSPLVYSRYKEIETPREIANVFLYFLFGAVLLCLFVGIMATEIVWVLAPQSYADAATVSVILFMTSILMGMYIFAPGVFLAKKTKLIVFFNTVAATTNTILCIILVPVFSINGAAVSTLVSALLVTGLYFHFGTKYYIIPYQWKPTCLGIGFFIIFLTINLFFTKIMPIHFGIVIFKMGIFLMETIVIIKVMLQIGREEIWRYGKKVVKRLI